MEDFGRMTPSSVFLLAALVIVAVPVVLLRISGLKGLLPLVAVQIFSASPWAPRFLAGSPPLIFICSPARDAVLVFWSCTCRRADFRHDFRPASRPDIFNGKERVFWPVAAASILCR